MVKRDDRDRASNTESLDAIVVVGIACFIFLLVYVVVFTK